MKLEHALAATLALSAAFHFQAVAEDSSWRPVQGPVLGPAVVRAGADVKPALCVTMLGKPEVRLERPQRRLAMPADSTEAPTGAIRATQFEAPFFSRSLLSSPAGEEPPTQGDVGKEAAPGQERIEPIPAPQSIGSPMPLDFDSPSAGVAPGCCFARRPGILDGLFAKYWAWDAPVFADESCLAGCGMLAGVHGPASRAYVAFDYLLWSLQADEAPPLVTTSPQNGSFGILGNPGTRVVAGGDLNQPMFSGGRVTLGLWLRPDESIGLIGSFFMLQQQTRQLTFGSLSGDPLYARPIIDATTGSEQSQLVSALFPPTSEAIISGTATVQSTTQLLGADLNLRWNLMHNVRPKNCDIKEFHLDLVGGFRYLHLNDRLTISEELITGPAGDILPSAPPAGTVFLVSDEFQTVNNFYGGQLGLMGEWRYKSWFLNFTGKVAIGATRAQVTIDGATVRQFPGESAATRRGGLLALDGTNIGTYGRTAFSVVPEIAVAVGYQISANCRVYVGYNLLFWTNVARPGDQIDRYVNARYLPFYGDADARTGPARPRFAFNDDTFWAQGLIAGLEWRF
jgi:hypothetical protein